MKDLENEFQVTTARRWIGRDNGRPFAYSAMIQCFLAGVKAGARWERREDAKLAKLREDVKRAGQRAFMPTERRVTIAQVEDLEYLLSFGGAMADRRRRIQAWLDGVIQAKKGRGK